MSRPVRGHRVTLMVDGVGLSAEVSLVEWVRDGVGRFTVRGGSVPGPREAVLEVRSLGPGSGGWNEWVARRVPILAEVAPLNTCAECRAVVGAARFCAACGERCSWGGGEPCAAFRHAELETEHCTVCGTPRRQARPDLRI